jgi:hypothetical protein
LISKNLFCTNNKNTVDRWLHKNAIYKNEIFRVYNSEISSEDLFHNEIYVFLDCMLKKNLKIYLIETKPRHDIIFEESDLNFLKPKNFEENQKKDFLNIGDDYDKYITYINKYVRDIPYNIKKIKKLQSEDLFNFYDFLLAETFFYFSKITDNKYHYNLLVALGANFDINNFKKFNFNTVIFDRVVPIQHDNLNLDLIKSIFNFNEFVLTPYIWSDIFDKDYRKYSINLIKDYHLSEEYKAEMVFLENSAMLKHSDPIKYETEYLKVSNESDGKYSELENDRLYWENYFSQFGWHFCMLNYNFDDTTFSKKYNNIYTDNDLFILADQSEIDVVSYKNSYIVVNDLSDFLSNGFCLDDLLCNTLTDYKNNYISSNIISVPKIKYNTTHKCRLIKKKIF